MHRQFATLSDQGYLAKLLAMHESLSRHSNEPFTLNVLAMDQETFALLYDMQLSNVELIPLTGFERALNLDPIRKSRSYKEFCWTCASSLMEYLMPWVDAEGVTYLDADLFFFSDPRIIFAEIGSRSIAITPHNFPPARCDMERNGIYNVGWVTARNTTAGKACISRWAAQCREWCYDRVEEHHACGDQKYLDTWPTDYPGEVCAISNIGVNVAPWNVSQWSVTHGPCVNLTPIVFYHMHEFTGPDHLTYYKLRAEDRALIYAPYVESWTSNARRIAEKEFVFEEQRKQLELQAERA